MSRVDSFFATQIYRAELPIDEGLVPVCLATARDDLAGRRWAKEHNYRGYTSYASLNDLPSRYPEIADLQRAVDGHVRRFARELQFARTKLALDGPPHPLRVDDHDGLDVLRQALQEHPQSGGLAAIDAIVGLDPVAAEQLTQFGLASGDQTGAGRR